jgi:putative NADH-flavin reductase
VRVFVIGATGHTGIQVLDLALSRGHEVTAFVRSPGKIVRRDPRLKIVTGDPHSVEQLTAAMPAHDVVISTLGSDRRKRSALTHWSRIVWLLP